MRQGGVLKIKTIFLTVGTLALLLLAMAAISPDFGGTAVSAQVPTPTVSVSVPTSTPTPTTTIAPVKQDNSGKWGLLGLLGLAGLGGLLKRPKRQCGPWKRSALIPCALTRPAIARTSRITAGWPPGHDAVTRVIVSVNL